MCWGLEGRGGAVLWALWLGQSRLTLPFASAVRAGAAVPVQVRGAEPRALRADQIDQVSAAMASYGCPLSPTTAGPRGHGSPHSALPLVTGLCSDASCLTLALLVRFRRISKAMLKWACWILTDGEVDS